MIKGFIKNHYILILLILIHVVTHHTWIFNTDYLTYGDARVYPPQMQADLIQDSLKTYATGIDLGSFELSGGASIIKLVHGLLGKIGIYYNLSFRVIYMYPYVFLAPVAIYLLTSRFIKNKFGLFCAGLVYLFNTYFLVLQTAGVTMLLANMWGTFMLVYYYKLFMEKRSVFNYLMIVLMSLLACIYEFRIFYLAIILCSMLVIYKFIFIERKWSDLFLHASIGIVTLILNSFWFLPVILSGQLLENRLFSRGLFGSGYFDLFSAFNLFHRFWTGGAIAQFVNQPIPMLFWAVPICVIIAIYKNEKNKWAQFFAVIAILGVFLTKQEDLPFPHIYSWLYNNFPGFNAFREASKFYFITAIGYSVLIGYFMQWLWETKFTNLYQRYARVLASILIAGIFLYNSIPLVTLELGSLFIPRHIPQEYKVYNEFIISQDDSFRTLWVPSESKWGYYSNSKPRLGFGLMSTVNWENLKNRPDYVQYDLPKNIIANLLMQTFSDNLIDAHSIKYVVVPTYDLENDDNIYIHFGNDRNFYLNLVSNLGYLKPLDIGTRDLKVFRNDNYKPRIYLTNEKETLATRIPYEEVEYTLISPTEYIIKLKDLTTPVYLNFSEKFDSGWALKDNNYFLDELDHFSNEYNLNTFVLDEKYENRELTLYYKPQAYFDAGILVSLGALATLITSAFGIVIFSKIRK